MEKPDWVRLGKIAETSFHICAKSMKLGPVFRSVGVLLVLLGLMSLFALSSIVMWILRFAEANFSPDNALSSASEIRITFSVIYVAAALIFLGGIFFTARKAKMRSLLLRIMQINPLSETERFPPWLIISTLTTFLLAATYVARILDPRLDSIYNEGGLLESLTAIALGISFLLVVQALRSHSRNSRKTKTSSALKVFYIILALGFFILAMEEISWGQQLFGWQTPPLLASFNLQGETNLHNAINDFALLYYPLALLLPLVLLSAWFRTRAHPASFILKILPPPNTIFTAALISSLSFVAVGINEFVEQLFALFALSYSAQLYLVESQEYRLGARPEDDRARTAIG